MDCFKDVSLALLAGEFSVLVGINFLHELCDISMVHNMI